MWFNVSDSIALQRIEYVTSAPYNLVLKCILCCLQLSAAEIFWLYCTKRAESQIYRTE